MQNTASACTNQTEDDDSNDHCDNQNGDNSTSTTAEPLPPQSNAVLTYESSVHINMNLAAKGSDSSQLLLLPLDASRGRHGLLLVRSDQPEKLHYAHKVRTGTSK